MTLPRPNESLTLRSGNKYAYHFHPSSGDKPTLLFLHGFPSTSRDWHNQISHFSSKGYGILAPDLLGYGLSSKPLDVNKYKGDAMSRDIITILNYHGLKDGNVVGIAHDWGTYLLSQLSFRYPEYFKQLVFVSVPYQPPGRGMDIERVNAVTKKENGFEQSGYWLFFTSLTAGRLIGKNWENFFSISYCENAGDWATDFAGIGGLERFLREGRKVKVGSWMGDAEEEARYHHEMFGDDYTPSLRWYHRGIKQLGSAEEKKLLEEGVIIEKISKQTLMITGTEDRVCDWKRARVVMNKFVEKPNENLKVVDLNSGHWVMLERRDEMNQALQNFLDNGASSGTAKAKI